MSTISLFSVLILLVLEVHSIPSYFPNIHYDLSSVVHRITGRSDGRVDRSVEMISWEPRAVIYHNFLSKDECEHVINIAKPHMKKSTVIDKIKGEIEDKWFRTGYITNLERGQDETIGAIEKRIADLTFLPVEYGEGFEVLRSDVEEGGEEVFPLAKGNISALACWNGKYTTHDGKGGGGLSVKPKMGDALLFWNIKPDGTMDLSSLYGGCPVIKGSKWAATKGIHFKEFKSWD
ncbi:putative procollagen-proline 4-dioxygenase [Helianthus annuus]|nr:putative procollagen-proline 4-dioxygenase [Helianthus annuus]